MMTTQYLDSQNTDTCNEITLVMSLLAKIKN